MEEEGLGRETPLVALYHRALPQVYGYLLPRCGSVTLAEDLTAETFMAAVAAAKREELRPSPSFAMLYRGDLRLLLSVPGQAHALPDGTLPDPGGWNRIVVQVPDLGTAVAALRARGVQFRHEIVTAVGVRQALLEDPSGNPVELFEPLAGYHERAPGARRE